MKALYTSEEVNWVWYNYIICIIDDNMSIKLLEFLEIGNTVKYNLNSSIGLYEDEVIKSIGSLIYYLIKYKKNKPIRR